MFGNKKQIIEQRSSIATGENDIRIWDIFFLLFFTHFAEFARLHSLLRRKIIPRGIIPHISALNVFPLEFYSFWLWDGRIFYNNEPSPLKKRKVKK